MSSKKGTRHRAQGAREEENRAAADCRLFCLLYSQGGISPVSPPESSLLSLRRKFQALPLGAKRQCEIANVDPPQTFLDQFLVDQNISKTKFTQNLPCIKWVKKYMKEDVLLLFSFTKMGPTTTCSTFCVEISGGNTVN